MANAVNSRYLNNFIKEIQYKNRNPLNNKVLKLLDELSTNPNRILTEEDTLFRCRKIYRNSKIEPTEDFWGFNAKDSFVPPVEYTRDMRANYRYIPYLYCANHPYTALVEVRPQVGSKVSVATIQILEPLLLLDFTMHSKPNKMTDTKLHLFSSLSFLFSKPVAIEDDTLDYIPTQYIAEYAKNLGYDGIAFESSLTPELNSQNLDEHPNLDRFNVVVFNYEKCCPIKSNVFEVCTQYTECVQVDEDPHRMDIPTTLLDMYF